MLMRYLTLITVSSFADTILLPMMNKYPNLPKKSMTLLKVQGNVSPLGKKDSVGYLELVKECYGYNDDGLQALAHHY